jgi:hypothetical protein
LYADVGFPTCFRYGLDGGTAPDVRQELVDHDEYLMSKRSTFAWIDIASQEYAQAVDQIYFLSNIHAKVLDVRRGVGQLVSKQDAEYWSNLVMDASDSGLIQGLAALNQIIQGLNTLNGISMLGVFKENAQDEQDKSICAQVHDFRDYLIGLQIQAQLI